MQQPGQSVTSVLPCAQAGSKPVASIADIGKDFCPEMPREEGNKLTGYHALPFISIQVRGVVLLC